MIMKKDILWIVLVLMMFPLIAYLETSSENQTNRGVEKEDSIRHESPYTQEIAKLENGQVRICGNNSETFSRRSLQLLLLCLMVWDFWKPHLGSYYWIGSLSKAYRQNIGRARKRRGPPQVKV